MEGNFEIIEDDVDYLEKEQPQVEKELIYIENQKEVELNQSSKSHKSNMAKSKLSAKTKKDSLGGQSSVINKIKSGNTSMVNKSLGITSLNSTKKSNFNNDFSRSSCANGVSFGERLYRKAVAMKEIRHKKTLVEKEEKNIRIKKECSFAPKVNDDSCLKMLKRTYDRSVDSSFATAKKKEIESYAKKKEEQELAELKPSIKRSKKDIEEITLKLYKEAEVLKVMKEREKENHYSELCTFTPKITDSSKPKLENFYKRLQTWIEKRNENYQKELESATRDSKTGQILFTPQVRRRIRESNVPNVFIDLYEENNRLNFVRKETIQKYQEELKNLANSKKATYKMDEINANNKFECFIHIFRLFDTDEDNLISYNEEFQKIFTTLDAQLQGILQPLVDEFASQSEALNREEFVMALEQLYNVITVDEKRRMVDWYVHKVKRENSPRKRRQSERENNFSFHPRISDASQKIFNESRRHSKDIMQRNTDMLRRRNTYISEKNEERLMDEIKECTFKPYVPQKSLTQNSFKN